MTDELITDPGQINALRVISRTSVTQSRLYIDLRREPILVKIRDHELE